MFINKQHHFLPDTGLESFLESVDKRLSTLRDKLAINEFSGKDVNAVKSICLQIAQLTNLSKAEKKVTILNILTAVEEKSK